MWQLSSSVPGPPCLLASPPVTLGIVLIMPPPCRGRCCHHGPPLTELSAHLLGLHTCTPLFWACWVPGLCQKCVLLFKPPSGACCTCPSPPVPSAGLLLACLPAASKLGCSASSVPEKKKKNSSNSHGCCIPLLTLSSSLPSQLQSTIKSVKDQADPNSRRY